MAIKVLMSRHVNTGPEVELEELLVELRARALKQPGYISGETLILASDPEHTPGDKHTGPPLRTGETGSTTRTAWRWWTRSTPC